MWGYMCADKEILIEKINICSVIVMLFAIVITLNPVSAKSAPACDPGNLYGVIWAVDGCSCSGDTITTPKIGAYAEDNIGLSRGSIDRRDLICDPKTGQWRASPKPKFATCTGCKKGYGTTGTCGPATQKLHASKPTNGLCTCGDATGVKKIDQGWVWTCGDKSDAPPTKCIAPAKPRQP